MKLLKKSICKENYLFKKITRLFIVLLLNEKKNYNELFQLSIFLSWGKKSFFFLLFQVNHHFLSFYMLIKRIVLFFTFLSAQIRIILCFVFIVFIYLFIPNKKQTYLCSNRTIAMMVNYSTILFFY